MKCASVSKLSFKVVSTLLSLVLGDGLVPHSRRTQLRARVYPRRRTHVRTRAHVALHGHQLTVFRRILWPIVVDQPINALYLTTILNAAYELLEVRHGSGLAPIRHSGETPLGTVDAVRAEAWSVFEMAFGADGAEKRARLGALRQAIRGSWEEGGSAVGDVEEFLDGLV